MEQKIPNITTNDIKRILKRDFHNSNYFEMEEILSLYNSDNIMGKSRVQAATLKLSNGDIALLKKYIELANKDFRDIIAMAEYPNYSQIAFSNNISMVEKEKLIEEDWIQYKSWLDKL